MLLCVVFPAFLNLSQESLGFRAEELEDGRVFFGFCVFLWRLSVVAHVLATVTNAAREALSLLLTFPVKWGHLLPLLAGGGALDCFG